MTVFKSLYKKYGTFVEIKGERVNIKFENYRYKTDDKGIISALINHPLCGSFTNGDNIELEGTEEETIKKIITDTVVKPANKANVQHELIADNVQKQDKSKFKLKDLRVDFNERLHEHDLLDYANDILKSAREKFGFKTECKNLYLAIDELTDNELLDLIEDIL